MDIDTVYSGDCLRSHLVFSVLTETGNTNTYSTIIRDASCQWFQYPSAYAYIITNCSEHVRAHAKWQRLSHK